MSFRAEEKILVSDNNDFLVKNFLKSNSAKKLYKPRIIQSLLRSLNNNNIIQVRVSNIKSRIVYFIGVLYLQNADDSGGTVQTVYSLLVIKKVK